MDTGPGRGALPRPGLSAGSATPAAIKAAVRAEALALGFDVVGFAPAHTDEATARRLHAFLSDGRHGDMAWMATTAERRARLQELWPEARTAIVLGLNYGPGEDPLALLRQTGRGVISCYARGDDYHDLIKTRLKRLAAWLQRSCGGAVKVFVDTAPVMEKPLAQRAGLGWQGKHTNLVSRRFGSWLFLGEVLTTLELPPDEPETDHCGSCRACLDICPTAAFPAPYQLDARRCISYLTIEHKGPIPREFRAAIGNRIYGCDDCLAVCPWNKFAARTKELAFLPRAALTAPKLAELAMLDDPGFRRLFAKSPVKRLKRDRFVRNVLIALANSGAAAEAPVAERLLDDPLPLVRGAAPPGAGPPAAARGTHT
ncbi:MAG: tRNA epoxyqueuosine(34) reductase QueG, partial [Rhodospirillaceae bacterium]|nr:tRNA epoxyqueuosine(34) reductase QueG [Rhodospirillaceae bacterium]